MIVIRSLTGTVLYSANILPQVSRIKDINDKQAKVQVVLFNAEQEKKYTFETLLFTFIAAEEKTSFAECFKSLLGAENNKWANHYHFEFNWKLLSEIL